MENKGYTGIYDAAYPVKIQYEDSAVDTIDFFIVNGEKIESRELFITADMIRNGNVIVQPVIKRKGVSEILYEADYESFAE